MDEYSIFDIIGPIMIGPSSSHTAGAQRLGKVAYQLAQKDIVKAQVFLHGSFAKTGKGHGTDRALAAGLLGLGSSDERLKDSLHLAQKQGVQITFQETDLGDVHPNSVKIIATRKNGEQISFIGSSIGGGNILINSVDGFPTNLAGAYDAVIISHWDKLGILSKITTILANHTINIVSQQHNRQGKGKQAITIIETDSPIDDATLQELKNLDAVLSVIRLEKMEG